MDPLDPTSGLAKLPDLMPLLFGAIAVGLVCAFALQGYFCWKLSKYLTAIPPKYRKRPPNSVWFLMVPVAGDFYSFSIYPGISQSYRAFFESMGLKQFGDCGENLGRAIGLASVFCFVPLVDMAAIPVTLLLTYLFMQRLANLRAELPVEARAA